MPTPSFNIICTRTTVIARDVYEITFEKPKGFTFEAGQFVLFDVPLLDNPEDIQTRAYSVASAPEEKELLFVIKLVPNGRASRWVEEQLRPGTVVRMQGPFGFFTHDAKKKKDILMVATGSGIAPFRSMLVHLFKKKHAHPIDLLFCVKNEEDLFWRETLEGFAEKHSNFRFHLTLSHPSQRWDGCRGRVQELIPDIAPDISKQDVYICGSPAMTADIKRLCLEEWGVEKKNLHVEGYI